MLSKIELIEYGAKVLAVFDEKVTMQEMIWILENVIEATNEVNQEICLTTRPSRAADDCDHQDSYTCTVSGCIEPCHRLKPPPA